MITNVYVEGCRVPILPTTNSQANLTKAVSKALHLLPNDFYLMQNGKLLSSETTENSRITVCMRLLGGKGGFGSMLRAIGAQIEKTTNREACRDLSGRRLRDINEEKRLKEYLEKQGDREDEAASKVAKKIERLRSKPKHEFKDDEYFEARSNLMEDVSDALEIGIQNAASSSSSTAATTSGVASTIADDSSVPDSKNLKRKSTKKDKKLKKKLKGAQWIDDGLSSSDSSDTDDEPSKRN